MAYATNCEEVKDYGKTDEMEKSLQFARYQ
jgi:hypothetical protein